MSEKCPNCGRDADELSRDAKTTGVVELAYRCTNPDCRERFTGLLTLSRSRQPGAQHFGAGDASGAGETKTDC